MHRERSLAVLVVGILAACKDKRPEYRDAAPRPPAGDLLGSFALTYYWVADEAVPGTAVTLFDPTCAPVAKVAAELARALDEAGTAKLLDGRVLGVARACDCPRSPCVRTIAQPWGVGVDNRALTPFISLSVDRALIPIGSHLYIDELDGVQLPEGMHDGCVVADDTGARMKGKRIDWFVGRHAHYKALDGALKLRSVTVRYGGTRCR